MMVEIDARALASVIQSTPALEYFFCRFFTVVIVHRCTVRNLAGGNAEKANFKLRMTRHDGRGSRYQG